MKCKLTISRNSNDVINITIVDDLSGIQFVDVALDLASFAQAITGCARIHGDMKVRELDHVGLQKITEPRSIVCPLGICDRKILSKWLSDNAQENGWILDAYLGSQHSIGSSAGNGVILNYKVIKYITPSIHQEIE